MIQYNWQKGRLFYVNENLWRHVMIKSARKYDFSSLFFKYLLSYVAILIIPVVVISGIMRSNFISMFDQQVITDNLNTLNRLMSVIDSQMNQIHKTALQIEINKNLRPVNIKDNTIKAITIKNELTNYVATNNFIENIFLYYRGDRYIYSSFGSCSIDMFVDDVYEYNCWDKNTFYDDINSLKNNIIFTPNNLPERQEKSKNFVFAYSLPSNSKNPYLTALFVVPEKSFRKIMESTVKDYTENIIVLDNNNQLISSVDNNNYLYSDDFKSIVNNSEGTQTFRDISISGKKYLMFFIKSDITGWKYISTVSIYMVRKKINTMQMKLISSIVLVLIFGGIIICLISRLNYKPIKNLKNYAKKIWNDGRDGLNEVETVWETLRFLSDENIQLDKKLKSGEVARKEHLLTKLLKGEIMTLDEFNQKGKDMNLSFSKDLYKVIMLKFKYDFSMNQKMKENIITSIEERLSNQFEAYIRDHIDDDKASLIIAFSRDNKENIKFRLLDLRNYVKEKWDIMLTLGVGNTYYSVSDIPKSYMEACTALDFRFIKGDGNIIFYEEITKEQSNFDFYPHEDIIKIEYFIKQGDTENIESLLGVLIDFIKDSNTPIFIARRICYDTINTVMRTMNKIYKEFAFVNAKYPDVFALGDFETIDQFIEVIKTVCYDICAYVNEQKYKECEEKLDNILDYVCKNYNNPDFSLQNAADRFNMSMSGISLYFKENTGQNILDYVSYLRMEDAKKMLRETNMTIKDICTEIGYYNASSFIRRFKQLTGQTPGEYRNNYCEISRGR